MELGEGGGAVECAAALPGEQLRLLNRERRANHFVDVAPGYSQWGRQDSALPTMLDTAQLASAEVRCRPAARDSITDLLQRSRTSPAAALRQLAARAGIAA